MRKIFSLLFLLSTLAAQQVPRPQVGLTGNIGPLGSFPLFNNGTINLASCADYTMTFPDMSATIIRVTSSASLTGTCNIIAPTSITAGSFGYEFVFQNATTGTASILVKGATGNGVTIANGQAVTVIFDGTNYVQVGAAGGPGVGICAPGQFVNALNLGAPPTCQVPSTAYISELIAANRPNTIFNGVYQQAWSWHFGTTSVNLSGLKLEEQDVGAGTGNSVVTISSFAGSPTTALTVNGPLNLPLVRSAPALGTDANGNIISTTPGVGPGTGPTYSVHILNTTSSTLATTTDFQNCTTFVITAGVPTLQLPTPAPPNGQCVTLINYTAAAAAISRAGSQTINGVATNLSGLSGNGQAAPSTWKIISDGTNYIMSKGFSGSITNLSSGTIGVAGQMTVGTSSQVIAPSTNTGNNGTVNGTRWNNTTSTLQVIGNNTATAGTTANIAASGNITADVAVYSPSYFTCTTANPCTVASAATAPLGRAAGGEPLSTRHLADFSDILATNGQVPIWNSSQNKYVPGPMTGGAGGPVSWDTINDPGGSSYLYMGNYGTLWEWDLSTPFASGLTIDDASSGNPTNQKDMLSITSAFPRVAPLELWSSGNKFLFDGSGDVTISKLANAPSLAADATGKLIPGSGGAGGPSSLSDLTAATVARPFTGAINSGNRVQTWKWDFGAGGAGQNFGGLVLTEGTASTATTGNGGNYGSLLTLSTLSNSSTYPLTIYPGNNGYFVVNHLGEMRANAGAKFVGPMVLTTVGNPGNPVVDAPALGTDAGGNIVPVTPGGGGPLYSARHVVPLLQATGDVPIDAPNCSAGICTAFTPTAAAMYIVYTSVVNLTNNTACTANGAFAVQLQWTDPDVTNLVGWQTIAFRQMGANTFAATITPGGYTGGAGIWMGVPTNFMAKSGSPVIYKIAQTTASAGCTPQIRLNVFIFGPY